MKRHTTLGFLIFLIWVFTGVQCLDPLLQCENSDILFLSLLHFTYKREAFPLLLLDYLVVELI